MPTIDDLPPANSVGDSDEFVVSQSDIARKATRAQLLSGVQGALAVPQNSLLGRVSAGIGAPENISIGPNLTISNGTINAPAPFEIASLPAAAPPQPGDLVAVAQQDQNVAANYSAFMGGLAGLSGISGSNLLVAPTAGVGSRRVADLFGDALSIECFGAIGDGLTDDTAAFDAAAQAGAPIRLGGKTYVVNGPVLISLSTAWLGISGETTVRRAQVNDEQPWIEFAGPSLFACGIIFDANGLAAGNSSTVQIDNACLSSGIFSCQFVNARGAGNGLLVTCGDGATHELSSCQFARNSQAGITVSGSGTINLHDCTAVANGGTGISVAPETACSLHHNYCEHNNIGIVVGNWQVAADVADSPPSCVVCDNACSNSTIWGFAIAGNGAIVANNTAMSNGLLGSGGGMVARVVSSKLNGNQISGGAVGLDLRTSLATTITDNMITGTMSGILLGACQNVLVTKNFFNLNQWAIIVSAIEPSLSYSATGPVSITENWIGFTVALGGGISAYDGCLGARIVGNDFHGSGSATINQALWIASDQAIVAGNTWNNQPAIDVQSNMVGGLSTIVIPDLADEVLVTTAANPISSLLTSHQSDTLGQISFIRVTDGGSGYSTAGVAIAGAGRGAAAVAVINQGSVIWVILTNPGSGYGAIGSDAPVTISGDGEGAAATAYVGIPVLTGKRTRLSCNCTVQLGLTGTSPQQQNWTNYSVTVPAFGAIELEGAFGAWRAVSFPAIDYLLPTGDGGLILQSSGGGNVTLRPGTGGSLHIANASEPTGCTSTVGRGAPSGSIVAPPGSDFRNLDGGAGNTLWIKQSGADATGWAAIA